MTSVSKPPGIPTASTIPTKTTRTPTMAPRILRARIGMIRNFEVRARGGPCGGREQGARIMPRRSDTKLGLWPPHYVTNVTVRRTGLRHIGASRQETSDMSKQSEFAVVLSMNPMFADLGADALKR